MRIPLTGSSINLAGQPSKVGGAVAKAFGFMVLAGGWLVALVLGVLLHWLVPGNAGALVGSAIALVAAVVATILLQSGKSLERAGNEERRLTRQNAVFALASQRGGCVTANDASGALGIRPDEADELLTELAKTRPDQVVLELDESGGVYYRFPALLGVRVDAAAPTRVAPDIETLDAEIEPPNAHRRTR